MKKLYTLLAVFLFFVQPLFAQNGFEKFDVGKMWTFEHVPSDYFSQTYGFAPAKEWLDDVRLSALRFGNGCSASFISEDGLVMTNHHCGRGYVTSVTREGEDFSKTGFWAVTLTDERPVPSLFVDRLMNTIDVTKEVQSAMEQGKSNTEKTALKTRKIKEIETKYRAETGLQCNVITFYNGGMYMLYCYKRYTDVRLVFSPENYIAHYGGDPDNFTYPRYDYDAAFFRVYENGAPIKTDNFFAWSKNGATEGEPLFVIGNPGSTERLKTYAQLEFARDYQVPSRLKGLNYMVGFLEKFLQDNPEKRKQFQDALFGAYNAQKVFNGQLKALKDGAMMERKKNFEIHLKEKVNSDAGLKQKYGNVWTEIESGCREWGNLFNELAGYEGTGRYASRNFAAARLIYRNALENKATPDSVINMLYRNYDADYNKGLLKFECSEMISLLGKDNAAMKKAFGGKSADEMVEYILSNSKTVTKEGALELAQMKKEQLESSGDPLFIFYKEAYQRYPEIAAKQKEAQAKIEVNAQMLGRVVFDIYGTSIPPDATLTLRISDGTIKSYEYNGTVAPPFTTFYGLYDRYFSHGKKYPWDLPERWKSIPSELKLETPYNLVSTNDIIGGNSGSAMINTNAEVVGLVFDGNIESLPGRYIYTTEANRTVSVDSRGLLEALKSIYKAERLVKEIENGKIQ
ncbi:MAG: S46 family peptidase [Ignavibacteria bacterium]|nr:S46 family peptidase [Ignavibacteria bacterium]